MITEKLATLINAQYHRELNSAISYFAISSYFLDKGLDGFANFFRLQGDEELEHARKQFDFLHDTGHRITPEALDAVQGDFTSPLNAFKHGYEHEQYITKNIHKIAKTAFEESDMAVYNFFQWFIEEQVEEESLFSTLIDKLELIGNDGPGLLQLDRELGALKSTGPDE